MQHNAFASPARIRRFRAAVYTHYRKHGRALPWRETCDPYRILVSEMMLQQTQVARVIEKYRYFIRAFPTVRHVARSPLGRILKAWQGLGYNRRALSLKKLACSLVERYGGEVPQDPGVLATLPGIGNATANAICAFGFNKPVVFMETNIRSVYIHHFFPGKESVQDAEMLPFIESTLDRKNPRRWYNALMDYGVYIKETHTNPGKKSASYARQSPFKGSDRQIRGALLKLLAQHGSLKERDLVKKSGFDRGRVKTIAQKLCKEGLIRKKKEIFTL
jgi:A/G-specific adenine glycosylase